MVLSNEDRGFLEKTIENVSNSYIPIWAPFFRNPENRKKMYYKEPDDVVFGLVWGAVMATFLPSVMLKFVVGTVTNEDLVEAGEIIYRRCGEIREKIFRSG